MKSKRLYYASATLMCCIFIVVSSSAQVIDNRLNVYASFSIGQPRDGSYVDKVIFEFPSLYNNLRFTALSLQGLYRVGTIASVGARIESMKGTEWHLGSSNIYNGAEANFVLFNPVLQVHSPYRKLGVFNRMKFYISAQPVFGQVAIAIRQPLSEIPFEGMQIFETSVADKTNMLGAEASAGIEVTLNQKSGFYTSYSFSYFSLQSPLCMDSSFKLSKVGVGIYYRLLKNKKYYY